MIPLCSLVVPYQTASLPHVRATQQSGALMRSLAQIFHAACPVAAPITGLPLTFPAPVFIPFAGAGFFG